ncbi:MAG: lysophospholipase [Verrucomicrobiota bacterium]|nr:lysophospholipase [Verrucomicrobiota bacterium]
MPGAEIIEGTLAAADGTRLFTRAANLRAPRANVILTHGLGEHSARYLHVADYFAAQGFRLCAYDLRGHGRSDGTRGELKNYDDFLRDLECVLDHFSVAEVPSFLYGHSLGGQITLNFLSREKRNIAGAVISSPWLRLAFTPNRFKVLLAKIALRFWPQFTQNKPANVHFLSRDQEFLNSMSDRDLIHHRVSARMFAEISRGATEALAAAPHFQWPLFLIHGDNDSITSHLATREFFDAASSPDKKLLFLPGHLHELHNELGRDAVLAEITRWIAQRVSGQPIAGYAISSQSP